MTAESWSALPVPWSLCNASGNTGAGILASVGSSVTGCTVSENTTDGITVDSLCRVEGNTSQGNGVGTAVGYGVHATGRTNRIDGNMATNNDRGIDVDAGGNLIVRNDASLNTINFSIVPGNTNANANHRARILPSPGRGQTSSTKAS